MPVEEVLDPPFCLFSLFYSSFNSYFKLGQFFLKLVVFSQCARHTRWNHFQRCWIFVTYLCENEPVENVWRK